jgi:SP family general alpha glucoside:H+ symporter-like MFS transporter
MKMSTGHFGSKHDGSDVGKFEASKTETLESDDQHEKNYLNSEVLVNPDLMSSAYDGENREHDMGTWEAVKLHPKACFWAFIFCFTIVCSRSNSRSIPAEI